MTLVHLDVLVVFNPGFKGYCIADYSTVRLNGIAAGFSIRHRTLMMVMMWNISLSISNLNTTSGCLSLIFFRSLELFLESCRAETDSLDKVDIL
jgi:hypothetical protein